MYTSSDLDVTEQDVLKPRPSSMVSFIHHVVLKWRALPDIAKFGEQTLITLDKAKLDIADQFGENLIHIHY